ncbi:unnamed protein product [Dibothriocephalus latus]|uniref:Uncharacterized protein n=1 Tax=Dibothriocephalus latus TaxID=60516 RepID=A0A3P7NU22_DIBLA|nr:unnamed protein product [Dibothriocephalus latus]
MEPLDNNVEESSNQVKDDGQILLWTKVDTQSASELLQVAYQSEVNATISRTTLPQNDPYFDELTAIMVFYAQNKQYSAEQLSYALSILAVLCQLCTSRLLVSRQQI